MIVALDYGEKNIGVAITDKDNIFAFPKFVIKRELFDANPGILRERIVNFETVTEIIIGLPKNLKGLNTIQTEKVLAFSEVVKAYYPDKLIVLFDEKFTSKIFEKSLKTNGESPKNFRDTKDMYEASIILEDYLRRKKNESTD
jgi:putative Holliday junction resolvase